MKTMIQNFFKAMAEEVILRRPSSSERTQLIRLLLPAAAMLWRGKSRLLQSLIALAVACFAATASAQTIFHVNTAQALQNALTTAAANGANNVIYVTNGYYIGTFNYNSSANTSLTITNEPNITSNTNIAIDGGGGGIDLNITCSGSSGNVTVSGITFMRNCGSYTIGALRISASSGGNITVGNCQFLTPTNTDEGEGLVIAAGLNTTIQNCTIIGKTNNGSFYDGNGISISGVSGGTTLIYSNTISANYNGYGMDITASPILTVTNNVFQLNWLGGLYFDPSVGSDAAQVLVAGNVFNGNKGNGEASAFIYNFNTLNLMGNIFSSNANNGGSYMNGNTVTNTGNTFIGNSGGSGGGTYMNLNLTAVVTGNNFSGNTGTAGGAYIEATNIMVTGNTFSGNSGSGDGGGGLFYIYNSANANENLLVSNNTFSANQDINGVGGGAYIDDDGSSDAHGTAIVRANTFTGNSCSGNNTGGALYVDDYCTNLIIGNTFEQNSSADGGGAISATTFGAATIISDNLVVNNSQSGAGATGGGILATPSTTETNFYMINNTVFGNTSGGGGGGASFQISGLTQSLYVFNNIIWGNSATGNGSDVYLSGSGLQTELLYNDVNGMYGVWGIAQNLLNVDPQFFNAVGGDYHFPGTSPCANAGTNGAPEQPLTDLDGNDRTNRFGQIDLGCYEYTTNVVHPADTNSSFVITAGEYAAYAAAWKAGLAWTNAPTNAPNPFPIPANYLTRAGYILTNGGAYTNDGSARPTNWKPSQ